MVLELDGRGPRYHQVTRAIRSLIEHGELQPGARVPSSRELARQLGCSRNVVLLAYELLVAGGYLVATGRHGTRVSRDLPGIRSRREEDTGTRRHVARPSPAGRRTAFLAETARQVALWPRRSAIDFIQGVSAPDPHTVACLKRGFAKVLRDRTSFFYGPPTGEEALRVEIARRLHDTRGIRVPAQQILITSGAQQALDLCARLLLTPGDSVIVEDPGYEAAHAVFAAAGARLVPVPVDCDGLDPCQLPSRLRKVRLIYLTPSHQSPTGGVLNPARRQAVLQWAEARGAIVLEDDYDGELRHRGQPLRALAATASGVDVIYCGTFAKTLFPSLRLGYLALPATLASAAASVKWANDRGSSVLMQRLVCELMESGDYDRHLRRMQRRYATRRAALTRALHRHLGSAVHVAGDQAGLHLVVWFPQLAPPDVEALVTACAGRDVGVYSVARHALRPLTHGGLILGYGLVDETNIEAGVRVIASAYHELRAQGP